MDKEGTSIRELWMLLGEKDVQIYQLLKTLEAMRVEIERLTPKPPKE